VCVSLFLVILLVLVVSYLLIVLMRVTRGNVDEIAALGVDVSSPSSFQDFSGLAHLKEQLVHVISGHVSADSNVPWVHRRIGVDKNR